MWRAFSWSIKPSLGAGPGTYLEVHEALDVLALGDAGVVELVRQRRHERELERRGEPWPQCKGGYHPPRTSFGRYNHVTFGYVNMND